MIFSETLRKIFPSSQALSGFRERFSRFMNGNVNYQEKPFDLNGLLSTLNTEKTDSSPENISKLVKKASFFAESVHLSEVRNNGGSVYEKHILPILNASVDFLTKDQVSADVETVKILAYLHDFVEDLCKKFSQEINSDDKRKIMDQLWLFLEKNFGEEIVKRLKLLNMDHFSKDGASKEVQDLERAYKWIKKINEMKIEEAIVKFHDLLNNADGTILRPTKFYQRFLIISAINVKFPGKFDTLTEEFYSRYKDKQLFPDVKNDFLPLINQITDPEAMHFFSNLSPETLVSGIYQ